MKRVYIQKIRSNKIFVSIMSMLLILSFILETSPTDILALTRSARNMTAEQSDGLEYQTISSFPGKSKAEIVTLDGLMPVKAEVNVQSSKEYTDGNLFAYDISITDQNGKEFQPVSNDPIKVEITNKMIGNMRKSSQKLRLWHIDNDGLREEIKNFTVEKNKIIFEASGFSVYEVDNGTPALRTYKFLIPGSPHDNSNYAEYYYPTNSQNNDGSYKEICSQTIKNGEKLIFPQLPADMDSKYTFVGWFIGSGGKPGNQQLDFNNIPAVEQNETVELYAVFEAYVYAIFHEQYNGRTGTFPVFATRRGTQRYNETTSELEATFSFDDLKVIYDDEDKEEGAPPSMQFVGWTTEPIMDYTTGTTPEKLQSPHTFSVSEDSNDKAIRLYPIFEPIRWLEFDSNGSGATYIPPKSFPKDEGMVFSNSVPVRSGYVFDGWYTAKDGGVRVTDSAQNLISGLSTDELEVRSGKLFVKEPKIQAKLYAHWTPGNSQYTVIIWKQKESDDKNAATKTYDYADSYTLSENIKTEQTVSVANTYKNKNYPGFYYSRCDDAKTVSGNGSTVLNVYYDRCKVVYKFLSSKNNNATTLATWTGLYGQKITKYGYTWDSSHAWHYKKGSSSGYGGSDGTVITYLESFNAIDESYSTHNESSHTYTTEIYQNGNNSSVHIYHVLQDLDGNYDINNTELVYETRVAQAGVSGDFIFSNKFEGFMAYGYSRTFTPNPTNNVTIPGQVNIDNRDLYIYHKRKSNNLVFVDSNNPSRVYKTEEVLYQAPIEGYKPANPTSQRPGYEFTNWYFNDACSSNAVVNFSNTTMPNASMIVYAGWETIWYRIEIDPNGGELSSTQATFFWEPYNGDPIQEYTNVSREYEADVNGTYYYAKHDRAFYSLGDEWEAREDSITDRGAYYTTDSTHATEPTRYRKAMGAYRYLGWFEVDPDTGMETPYYFGEPVLHDTHLRLHWKQLGTFYIKYDAGEGTIDSGDQNETTFQFLDADDYADHADVVVTRVAKPVNGKNFVGWRMKNDPSGKVYYPGQSFHFSSEFAEAISQVNEETGAVEVKRTIIMEAVYDEIQTAKIIYDANGGYINDPDNAILPANAGGQIIDNAPSPVNNPEYYTNLSVKYSVNGTQLTVSDLLNNSAVKLSNGTGFYNNGYTFLGWSPNRDGTEVFYDKDSITTTDRWVDINEPTILYAQWEVKVYFDKNDVTSGNNYYWGNGTGNSWATDNKYTYDNSKKMYYTTVKLNGKANKPVYTPTSSDPEEMFSCWSLEKQSAAGVMKPVFEFSTTSITQELITSQHNEDNYLVLYACWAAPIRIPVYYVDTSGKVWERKDGWRRDGVDTNIILRDSTHRSLANKAAADVYAKDNATDGFEYAFASESGKGDNDYNNITENAQITEIWYDSDEMCVKVRYSDNTIHEFDAANDAVYLVYYKSPEFLPIGYDLMAINGSLTSEPVNAAAPKTASVVIFPTYDMNDNLTSPIAWATYDYSFYSYAIGKVNAASAADLMFITGYKTNDNDRPELKVRNTWKGFEYSTDGTNWNSCGYDIALYTVYYEELPTIVNLREETIALPNKMGTEFEYQITVTQTESKTVTRTFGYYDGFNRWNDLTTGDYQTQVFDPTSEISKVSENTLDLSNGGSDSYVLFYISLPNTTGNRLPYTINGVPQTYRPNWWSITTYNVYYQDETTNQTITQTITITQTANNDFTTSNDAVGGDQVYNSNYTSSASADPVTITYTNRQNLKKAVNVAVSSGDSLTARNNLRTKNTSIYQHDFTNSADWNVSDTAVVSPSALINNNSAYVFLGIITGTKDNGSITREQTGITKLSFGEITTGVYGYYLNGDTTQLLGDQEIWFIYAKNPTIRYLYQKPDGTFETINPLTRNNTQFTRSGNAIAQNEIVPVNADGLLIDQISTPAAPAFLIPGDLDYNGDYLRLDLNRVSVGNSAGITDESDSEFLQITITDKKLQYRFSDTDTPKTFAEDAVIYAVYKIKGYELTLTKQVLGDSAGEKTFTFEVSSDKLTYNTYDTSTGQVTANSNKITVTVQRGASVTIYGLLSGAYTIKETTAGIYEMTAKVNGTDAIVNGTTVAASINSNTEVKVINTYPIPITGAGEQSTPYVVVTAVVLLTAAILVFICKRKGEKRNELSSL